MSFDAPLQNKQRIAIIGGGVSGLAAAYHLGATHDVTLYEAEARLGGHARTVMAGKNGDQPVDTGFIVFNYETYPHFTRMLDALDVPVAKSDMSFGASVDGGAMEYSLQSLNSIFGQRRNIARPRFVQMIRDLTRFNRDAEGFAISDDMTIAELVAVMGLGEWFQRYYLMPMCGAIWSTSTDEIQGFPAKSLINFFRNHALLGWQQHQWMTIDGGSIQYVNRLVENLRAKGVTLRSGTPVKSVVRRAGQATVHAENGPSEVFDQVVFATHSDDALRLLSDPTGDERAALGNLNYQDNSVYLHCDRSQMPNRKRCWSSWNYQADTRDDRDRIGVSYWMNRLQNIPETDPMFITLNPAMPIREETIYDQATFRHPVFDGAALRAQHQLRDMQGQNGTWYAGAYTRYGFHEDGFASGVAVADGIQAMNMAVAAE